MGSRKLKGLIGILVIIVILSFAVVCSGSDNPDSKEDVVVIEEKEKTSGEDSEPAEEKDPEEEEFELSEEAEYLFSVNNVIGLIGNHLIIVGEASDDYDYGDITLEDFKAYIGDFMMMFEESYYPDYLDLEPPVGYEDYYKDIGRFMEHIRISTEYFQDAIDSENENEMQDNLDKALLEIEQGNEWLEKANEQVN